MKENKSFALDTLYIAMNESDIEKVKSFCESTKMIYNEKVDDYDFESHKRNIRLCGYGKTDRCVTASIWYSPRDNDYCVRLEKDTRTNLMRSSQNEFLLTHCFTAQESRQSTKQDEFKYLFTDIDSALKFFSDLQTNYHKFVANNKTREVNESETIIA